MADLSITAASVLADTGSTTVSGTYGATVTAGETVYKDVADSNKWKPADANVSAAVAGSGGFGIALNGGADGQPADVLTAGLYTVGAAVLVGVTYVLSATAGGIAPDADISSGSYKTVIGVATTTAKVQVTPILSGETLA